MYTPKFTITNKILKYIGVVESAREVIENAPLVPAWEAKFREEALVRTVHHGTHIEGNELNITEAEKVLAGAKIVGRDRDIQEVLNYRNVLQFIEQYDNNEISSETLKHVHSLTVYRMLADDVTGEYRRTQVVVKNSATGEITFRPPPAVEIPFLIDSFLRWLNGIGPDDMHAVLKAGIVHYELVRIHPFLDGNGRVARAAATLVLVKEGYDIKRFFSLEEYYDREPLAYYDALQSVAKQEGNLTNWIEYFTEGLAIELTRIKEKVKALSTDLKIKKSLGGQQLALSERQIKVVEFIQENGFLQNKAFFELFPMISEDTVLREIKDLIKKGILRKEGSTKGVKYVLTTGGE
ncbi:MAG: Fic family protein [Candidatus Gottesmanbacteria bacterium]|nr:Fic family protein [Candidatus Gottesmanbacteria bacterium]